MKKQTCQTCARLFESKTENKTPEITKLYNVEEAASFLHFSIEHTRRLCREGKLAARKIRKKYYLTAEAINAALGE